MCSPAVNFFSVCGLHNLHCMCVCVCCQVLHLQLWQLCLHLTQVENCQVCLFSALLCLFISFAYHLSFICTRFSPFSLCSSVFQSYSVFAIIANVFRLPAFLPPFQSIFPDWWTWSTSTSSSSSSMIRPYLLKAFSATIVHPAFASLSPTQNTWIGNGSRLIGRAKIAVHQQQHHRNNIIRLPLMMNTGTASSSVFVHTHAFQVSAHNSPYFLLPSSLTRTKCIEQKDNWEGERERVLKRNCACHNRGKREEERERELAGRREEQARE